MSNSKESPNSICEEFQIAHKKLYEALMGKQFDLDVKLTKAEKAQRESEAKLKKLKTTDSKGDQDKDKENATSTLDTTPTTMDTSNICYLVGLGLNCKFIDLLLKCSVIKFIKISSHLDFIVSEIIYNQTDTLTQRLMDLR